MDACASGSPQAGSARTEALAFDAVNGDITGGAGAGSSVIDGQGCWLLVASPILRQAAGNVQTAACQLCQLHRYRSDRRGVKKTAALLEPYSNGCIIINNGDATVRN